MIMPLYRAIAYNKETNMIDPLAGPKDSDKNNDSLGDASNPAPEANADANPAPQAPEVEATAAHKTFDDSNPDDRFNRVSQGDSVELTQISAQLKKLIIGVGWDLVGFDESAADLDVSLFLLNKEELTRDDNDFIFYKNLEALDGGIVHTGDSRTGAGSGDDEQIHVDLTTVPFDVHKIMVVLSIHDPEVKGYSFKNVRNVYMRVEDTDTERELFRYFLDEELNKKPEDGLVGNGLYIGCLLRDSNDWIFNAIGDVDSGGLGKIATKYGMVIVG